MAYNKGFTPPHSVIRMERIKGIWEKEWKAKQNTIPNVVVPRLVSFSIGFIAGTQGHGWIFWGFSVVLYFFFFYGIKYVSKVYQINI